MLDLREDGAFVANALFERVVSVIRYPVDPAQRIYWLYLLSSIVIAYLVYRSLRSKPGRRDTDFAALADEGFFRFLFPAAVWRHPSAWLDLRYALFHKVVSFVPVASVGAGAFALGLSAALGDQPIADAVENAKQNAATGSPSVALSIIYLFVFTTLVDFVAWFSHYLQHKIPVLWQFHKVHHSSEVMHPISNYREHPIDNLFYALTYGAASGVILGAGFRLTGQILSPPTILGISILTFFFNFVAYNLRHSHIWLRWPGVWSKIFPSPAHHHVHHSRHPDHIDKNFGFMLPVWDVIFGTYELPEDNRDVIFGVPEEDGRDLDTILRLYWIPFRDVFRLVKRREEKAKSLAA